MSNENIKNPKPYLVLTDYNYEGWSISEADTFEEAIKIREQQMSYGHDNVIIAKHVKIRVTEEELN